MVSGTEPNLKRERERERERERASPKPKVINVSFVVRRFLENCDCVVVGGGERLLSVNGLLS